MDTKDLVKKEILDFHENIENWFKGNSDNRTILLNKLLKNFHPHFRMTGSRGNELNYKMLANWLPTVFGKFSEMEISVSAVKIQFSDKHALAEYVEKQNADGEITTRKASAVFLLNPDGRICWYHLLEEWV